jgi:hypothetical protein
VNEHESAADDAAWQPFVDALCLAASTWDADLGQFSIGDETRVPISSPQAENVMLALAALTRRMAAATALIVRAIADDGLDPASGEDELSAQVELLGRMASCAEAMHQAAEKAQAVVNHAGDA